MQDTEQSPPDEVPRADESDDARERRRPFIAADVNLLAYVERGEISPTAGFLYLVLLKHFNGKRRDKRVWPSREALAKALHLNRPESVDPHLKALRDAGLISWEAWRIGGLRARNRYTLNLIADTKGSETTPLPVPRKTAQRTPVQRAPDTPWTEDELEQEELPEDELDPKKEREWTAPPSGGGASKIQFPEDPWAATNRKPRDDKGQFDDWRAEDLDEFASYVGNKLSSDGSNWGADGGSYTAKAIYDAMRRWDKPKVAWPGRYLRRMVEDGRDVEDWLIDQGLETVHE